MGRRHESFQASIPGFQRLRRHVGENVDIAAAFGGVSQAAFGPRGAISTLAKITWVLAGIFVVTSITLAVWATKHSAGSIMEKAPTQQSMPSTPAPAKK